MRFSSPVFGLLAAISTTALAFDAPDGQPDTALTAGPAPKAILRKPDQEWEHVVKGADLLQPGRRRLAGDLAKYVLRAQKADPAQLGVDTVKQYSGYLDDNDQDKHLFYWFFESRNNPAKDPVVLWLNGGPGCSSISNGLFDELGPAKIPNPDLKPVRNPNSWNNNASVIFLDQPVNTGYSYSSKTVSTTAAAAKDVYALLTLFFHQFPQYSKQDFHISGESYAGHYIPIIAQEIMAHKNRNINIKSALIGNGITDPLTQYRFYRPMACGEGGYPAVLSESDCREMDNILPRCESSIQACYDTDQKKTCADATNYCNDGMFGIFDRSNRNVYDLRKKSGEGAPSYSDQFLNQPKVREALGAEVDRFDSCNGTVNGDFVTAGDWMKPIHRSIPGLLAQKLPILIYAGDADFICNWLGNRAWTRALEWPGRDAFNNATDKPLRRPGADADYGKFRTASNFTFMQIFGAGHMVPADQPEASLDFMNRWIRGEWFSR
ncbi:hypothetical protein CDD82_38 [Ophiocordyceps australis]|uniref:Carboxypeptidase n=1 Tax=Ophiocordyceps australis TaxID=1399860 RepID=A0A2C5ZV03_9HYPO|nr:hypothetical protein CDD82_38 [Ophiocordyceps australis]